MKLTFNGEWYELYCHKDDSDLPRKAGFTWNGTSYCWVTPDGILARLFKDYADPAALEAMSRVERKVRFSSATDSTLDVPCPKGLSYMAFQKAGIDFALKRENTLIGDGMRLGKTVQAIGVINSDKDTNSILVTTKAALKINWERELQKWLTGKPSIGIYWPEEKKVPKTDIVITNYENVMTMRSELDKRKWDLVIFDESHKLANPSAIRTKACFGDGLKRSKVKPIQARRRIALSGTPITKRPVSLWPMCREFDPLGLGSDWMKYTKRYCGAWLAPWGYDTSGKSHLEELQARLRSSFMIRRVREEVLTELPAIRRQVIAIPSGAVKDILKKELEFTSTAYIIACKKKAEEAQASGDEETFNSTVKELRQFTDLSLERMSALRHETALAKVPYVADAAKDALEEEEKIVIFGHHHDVIEGLATELKDFKPVLHYGRHPELYQNSIDKFLLDDKCRVFIGSITGAEGYSVASASYCLFAEFDWLSTAMRQAEDRLWLLDKKDSLLYQYFVFDGSLDANMAKDYVETEDALSKAIGG